MTQRAFISEEEVERALNWPRDNAKDIGAAKEISVKCEKMVKHTVALLMKEQAGIPVNAQEREALADPRYLKAIEQEAAAAGVYETMKGLREAAALKIEAWQTMSANYRAMKI